MTAPNNKPISQELKGEFISYYNMYGHWNNLNAVLGAAERVGQQTIEDCKKICSFFGDAEGEKLAEAMKGMSKSQLLKMGRYMRNGDVM